TAKAADVRSAVSAHIATMLAPVQDELRALPKLSESEEARRDIVFHLHTRSPTIREKAVQLFVKLDKAQIMARFKDWFTSSLRPETIDTILAQLRGIAPDSTAYRLLVKHALDYRRHHAPTIVITAIDKLNLASSPDAFDSLLAMAKDSDLKGWGPAIVE